MAFDSSSPSSFPPRTACPFGADLLISLLVPPFLLSLLGINALNTALCELGLASEELFRGERLPLLSLLNGVRND